MRGGRYEVVGNGMVRWRNPDAVVQHEEKSKSHLRTYNLLKVKVSLGGVCGNFKGPACHDGKGTEWRSLDAPSYSSLSGTRRRKRGTFSATEDFLDFLYGRKKDVNFLGVEFLRLHTGMLLLLLSSLCA